MKIYFVILFLVFGVLSCIESNNYDFKDNIYAEKHKIYSTKDTLFTNITVYYAKVKGHDVIYNVFSGKNKCQMEITHIEKECSKCNKK